MSYTTYMTYKDLRPKQPTAFAPRNTSVDTASTGLAEAQVAAAEQRFGLN
jgi:hypothetical protein